MTTVELRALLGKSIAEDGPIPVIIYENTWTRYNVRNANPCSQNDHFLISIGDIDRS